MIFSAKLSSDVGGIGDWEGLQGMVMDGEFVSLQVS
jgi:hypothetical protein